MYVTLPPSGAVVVCERAPPSLQALTTEYEPCGEGALSEIADRASTVRVNGAAQRLAPERELSRAASSPASRPSCAGSAARSCFDLSPSASVAVADSSR